MEFYGFFEMDQVKPPKPFPKLLFFTKKLFLFHPVESLPLTPESFSWKTVFLSQDLCKIVFSTVSLERGFSFFENSNSDTLILCFYCSIYGKETLELHLTGIKTQDHHMNPIVADLHLTLRCKNKEKINSKSFRYSLQCSGEAYFRFVLNETMPSNQNDEMQEFVAQQGCFYYSSATLHPILEVLKEFTTNQQVSLKKNCVFFI